MSPSRRARVGNDSESVEKTLLEVPVGLAAQQALPFLFSAIHAA